ncbi:MAG: hypothetical protein L6461_23115 [Anaerolineae bacterium]|nr:hypothetical protein [Anaerolineae bacterium]
MFKKLIYVLLALILFALVWAAGHDIIKGEPEVWQEWVIVIAGTFLATRFLLRLAKRT